MISPNCLTTGKVLRSSFWASRKCSRHFESSSSSLSQTGSARVSPIQIHGWQSCLESVLWGYEWATSSPLNGQFPAEFPWFCSRFPTLPKINQWSPCFYHLALLPACGRGETYLSHKWNRLSSKRRSSGPEFGTLDSALPNLKICT